MYVLSIDVGIKNLALCLFNIENKTNYKIEHWDVVNLCNEVTIKCECGKNANYKFESIYSCKKHTKNHSIPIIAKELEFHRLKKYKIVELRKVLEHHNISFDAKISKVLLLEYLQDHIEKNYFIPFSNKIKTTELSLIDIGVNMKHMLDGLYKNKKIKIDTVIIENQISTIASRMKTLQGMIAQYFIMYDINDIHFISASNKLKDYIHTKTTYTERKSKGIEICEEILVNNHQFSENLEMFGAHKKKDDLADCFLQGLWFVKAHIIYNQCV